MPDTLTCIELVELVTDYLEDALTPESRARFEEHLATCSGCTNYLDQMRRTIETVGRLSAEQLDPEACRDMIHVFRDWREP